MVSRGPVRADRGHVRPPGLLREAPGETLADDVVQSPIPGPKAVAGELECVLLAVPRRDQVPREVQVLPTSGGASSSQSSRAFSAASRWPPARHLSHSRRARVEPLAACASLSPADIQDTRESRSTSRPTVHPRAVSWRAISKASTPPRQSPTRS